MEVYQSGRTEPHSKCGCRVIGTWVRIPPLPPSGNQLNNVRNNEKGYFWKRNQKTVFISQFTKQNLDPFLPQLEKLFLL